MTTSSLIQQTKSFARTFFLATLGALMLAGSATAAAFTAGNIVVYRVDGNGAALNGSGTAVFLDEYTPAGSLVQSVALPNTGSSGRLVAIGNATTEGFMSRSQDGQYLIVPGYDALVGAATPAASMTIPRAIARVDFSGAINATTTYVDAASPGNLRSATSDDGTRFWTSGSTQGARTIVLGASTATVISSTATNMRQIGIFGSQLYIGSGAGTVRMATVGTGLPTTTGQTMTQLPGLPTATAAINSFFFADLSAGVAGVDTLYLCDETAGQIQKWTLAAGTWTQTGSVVLATARGLTGTVAGSNVTLYATGGGAGTPIVSITDTSGYNAALTGTVSTVVATAGTNKAFRGIAMAPQTAAGPAPTVSSINRAGANPTNAASVSFTVTFDQSVTGVDSTDFTVPMAAGLTGAFVTGVSGSGTTYTITVNTGSGSGTVGLNLVDDDTIKNGSLTPLGGIGAGNGNFTGQVYTIDKTPPTVLSILRIGPPATNAAMVQFAVTFSEPVTGVDAADFTLATMGLSGVSILNVGGSMASYTVTVGTGSGDGPIRIDVLGMSATISDVVGNPLTADFTTGDVITIDRTPPAVLSDVRANTNPTGAASVGFTVTFTEPVTGVDPTDFALTTTGVTGTSIIGVAGMGTTYTVTVNTGSGVSGTIRLDVNAGASIADPVGNPFGGAYTGGEVYNVDKSFPFVTGINLASGNPTTSLANDFTVSFSTAVNGIDPTDFTLTTTGTLAGGQVLSVGASGTNVIAQVTFTSGEGTVKLNLIDNDSITSQSTSAPLGGTGAGNGDFTTGQTYTIDTTSPAVQSITRADPSPTNAGTVHYTVTFTEPVIAVNVDATDFALAASGVTGAAITNVTGTGATYTVTVTTGSGDGTLGLNLIDDDSIHDLAGNLLGGSGAGNGNFTGAAYTIDRTGPGVLSINRANATPTSAAAVDYTVTFNEPVTGVDSGDFSLVASGPAGTSISGVTGSGTTYTVTVNTGSGDGTLHLDLADNDSIVDAASNPLGGSGAGNGNFTGQTYTVDKIAPSVVSINRVGSASTNAASVDWTVTFSEPVTGVDTSDFTLAATGVTGASVTGVTGSGAVYTVSVNTGSGDGTLGLNLADNDSIVESNGFGTALGGPGAGNGNFTGQLYTLDRTPPVVTSINRAVASPTSAASVTFTAVFSKAVTGVNAADFAVAATALSGSGITNVSGSGTTYTVTVATGTGNGTLGLNLVDDDSIIDSGTNPLGGPGAGNGNFTGQIYTVNRGPATHVVISQVYGGGGNAGAFYKNDFIELFNPTGATVDLTGWSAQYTSSAGSTWQVTNLTGTIAPGHYYLVQEAAGANGAAAALPTPDATGASAMAAGAGKVALVNQNTALSGSCPSGITIIDFVGYGAANCSETSPTATLTNTTSASRIDNGCTDSGNNSADFTAGTVTPRNSASTPWSCGNLVGAGTATPNPAGATDPVLLRVTVTPGQSPASTGITVTGNLTPIGGAASQPFFDNGTNGDVTPGDNIFSFSTTVGAATTSGTKTLNVALADAEGRNGAGTISLTVLGATNPTGTGSANPASVAPSQSSLLTVTTTPGQHPVSTGITVAADLTPIGGSATQSFFDDGSNGDVTIGDGTFSFNATVAPATPLGPKTLTATISDVQARTSTTNISLTIQSASAPPAPTNLVATPGNAQVSLTWTASAGATGYHVQRGTVSGGPYTTIASNVPTNNYTDSAAANGTHYYYIVIATNGTADSGPSNEANAIPASPPPMGSLAKIYFIDIGQGASTLIMGPTGKTLLVDGGPTGQGTAKIVPFLTSIGVSTIDFTVLTHYHIDHDDGLTETINANRVAGTSYDNGDTTPLAPPNAGGTKTAYQNYVNALAAHSGTITRVRPEDTGGSLAGTVIDLGGGMTGTIVAQGGKLLSGGSVPIDNSDLNTESISVLIQYNNFDFLVSGDLTGGGSTSTAKTPDVETFVAQLTGDIDVVEYDHHGSTTANNPRFLRLLKAEAAVAECGFTNTFGHPNRETVNKYLNIPATSGNTYGGTALPNPGNGPVSYQTDPSPASDDRVSRQGYSGAAPANAGNGTILLQTDGTSAFTMESFEDAGARISAAAHGYSLDAAGAGVMINFPPTVIPEIIPVVPLSTDAVTVKAMVNDREDPISSVTLTYSLNGASQAPQMMALNAGFYEATIAAQPDGTRVTYTVTAVAGGQTTANTNGYFAGTTPMSSLRVLDPLGEPLYLDYAARIAGTATSDTNVFSVGTNDDYIQDATGGINVWRTIQPSVPAVQSIATGSTYTVAGRIGELAGRFHIEVTPPFASLTTPYQITSTGSGTVMPATRTIAQILANPEAIEGQLISIANCTKTAGTIPGSPASFDAFLTITDGTGSFQLKVDKDTDVPGMATPSGTFTAVGIIQQDDFLRPFDSGYDITPRSRVDLGGSATSGPGLISIAAARIDVDGSGNSPGDYVPDLLNSAVHIQGVVTSINFRQSNGSGIEYYVQDSTAGVDVFSTATTRAFAIGDNLDVIATVKQFNGLTEIDPGATTSNLTVLAPGTLPAVSPQLVTASQLGDSGAGEPLEGKLLRVNNITLTAPPATWAASTNYAFTDSSGSGTIRISASSSLVGQAPPAGTFSIVGVLGQFDSAAPFDSGYQLFPGSAADILPAVGTPASITATAGTPQSATVGATFATPLQATVRDAGNAVISGVGVTFTAPASGASGTFPGGSLSASVITNASGIATAPAFTANATTGGYSVTASSGMVITSFSLTNIAQSATHFSVSAPATVTNGVAFSVIVTALTASNATDATYTGTVHFSSTSNGTLPSDYAFTAGDNGTHTFSFTLTSNGSQSIDAGDGSISGSANLTVLAPPATHFSVSAPASVSYGVAFNVTVTALDASNATVTGYTGTVHFTSSASGTLPADYTFTGGDAGVHTFSVTLTAAGMQSISVVDGGLTGTTNTTVSAAPATHFNVIAPASTTNGVPFNVTVTALNASNDTVVGYAGTVHLTSSSAGTLPADYTFTGGDAGAHTFSVTLTTNGMQTVTATDTVTMSITGSGNTTVSNAPPPPATHFSVTLPAITTNGMSFNVTVTALDASNASVAGYTGTVHFTSSSAGTLPADYTFTGGDAGTHTFSVTLTTNGMQTVTATDTVTASITGSGSTTVSNAPPPPAATHFSVTAPASTTTGNPFNVTVTALDASNATVTGYSGTVHFTTSAASATLPANYTFAGGDNGTHTFTVTLGSPGPQTITATDTVTASITGSASTTVVCPPGPAPFASASNSGPACAGGSVNLFASGSGNIYSWTGPGGFTSMLQNPTGITVAGTYTVMVTSTDPCVGSAGASTIVVINPIPVATITAGTVCGLVQNTASVPNAGAGATYAWTIGNGTITGGNGTNAITFTPSSAAGATLGITVTAAGCPASSSKHVSVSTAPTATLPAEILSCGGGSITIPVTLTGTGPWNLTWSDNFVQNGVANSNTSRTITASQNTTLSIVSVTDAGCTGAASNAVSIRVDTPITITHQPENQVVKKGDRATFTVVATGTNPHYQWYFGPTGNMSFPVGTDQPSYETWAIDDKDAFQPFWVKVSNGCGSVQSVQVTASNKKPKHRGATH
jgi:beta-lactamase superfamily II metal-dependent hydrolase